MNTAALFSQAVDRAKSYRDEVIRARQHQDFASSVVVVTKTLGPDLKTRVPCGEETFPRCVADQFEHGRLTVTAIDDGFEMRNYGPDEWDSCAVYGSDGHLLYCWKND